MGRLNRQEIVFEGLQRGGQPGLVTRANYFINSYVEFLYKAHPWDFLLTTATVSSGVNNYELDISVLSPEYNSMSNKMVIHTDNVGEIRPAWEFGHTYNDLWAMIESDNLSTGQSTLSSSQVFMPAPDKQTILVYPDPKKPISARIRYYRLPDAIDVTAAGDGETFDWPDDESLILAVEEFAKRWRQMNDLQITQAIVAQAIARMKATLTDAGRGTLRRIGWAPWYNKQRNRN